jgi:hypothetical protein
LILKGPANTLPVSPTISRPLGPFKGYTSTLTAFISTLTQPLLALSWPLLLSHDLH